LRACTTSRLPEFRFIIIPVLIVMVARQGGVSEGIVYVWPHTESGTARFQTGASSAPGRN
jgi:hypothetical protein